MSCDTVKYKKPVIDMIVSRLISRKFTVFLTATALMLYADLTADVWGMIAMCYIGGQSAIDLAKMWRHGD
tara:strand:+ start:283 stop:492 length:210 start_codon:yes stop_codon:yes gene_type:complete